MTIVPLKAGTRAPAEPKRRRRIGLALGSGSARGWAHIGVIEALAEQGIHPHVVCGSSIGAFVASAYVSGQLEALETWARRMNWRQMAKLADVKLSGGGLIEGERLLKFLRRLCGDVKIQDLDIPFAAVAADLNTGEEVWLRDGSLVEAVRASMALPGLMAPVRKDDWQLADGGLVNPIPVAPCRALGADVVIAVNLNGDLVGRRVQGKPKRVRRRKTKLGDKPSEEKPSGDKPSGTKQPSARSQFFDRLKPEIPKGLRLGFGQIAPQLFATESGGPGYFNVLFGAINVMQDRITRDRLAADEPEILIEPRLRQISLLEFNRAEEAIEEGRAAVEQAMPALEQVLGHKRRRKRG